MADSDNEERSAEEAARGMRKTGAGTTGETGDVRTVPIEFRGDGFEYFKIWIVNIILTILTLGIYSAWAKVRNKRYFYSNLFIDGHSLDYLADPITILKGRVIAVVALIAYSLAVEFYPIVGLGLALVLMALIPWLIVRSLSFNNRMSAYRNVQFRFHGTYGEAAIVLFVWPLLAVLSLGLLYPSALLRMNRFIVSNSSYGTAPFEFEAELKDYWIIFGIIIAIFAAGAVLASVFAALLPPLVGVVMMVVYVSVFVYASVAMKNLYYNSTFLREHGFDAHLEGRGLFTVYAINLVLVILTLGLYLPAAKVRLTRYIADHIDVVAVGSLDDFAAAEAEQVSALGEEMGEVFDFDIGVI